jgi:hypothetical protein
VAAIYLWINAFLYLIFALWMTVLPQTTSRAVGYLSLSNSGRSEFLVVYGGLQLGLALFFAWTAYQSPRHTVGLVFALFLYAPIVLYRVITVVRFSPVEKATLVVGALEVLLLVGAVTILLLGRVKVFP